MEARGIRARGLSHRNPEDREVQVNRYISTMPKTFGLFKSPYKTPDEIIYEIADNKEAQNKVLLDLLKENNRDRERKSSRGRGFIFGKLRSRFKRNNDSEEVNN